MTETTVGPPPLLKHPFRHRLEAAAAYVVFGALKYLPIGVASGFGAWLGRAVGPWTGAHRTAARNLARALPERTAEEQVHILRQAWDNFGRTMMEYAVLPRLARESIAGTAEHIIVEGYEAVAALTAQGKPAILFGAHLGNWETVPPALARTVKPMTIVYRPPNNPLVDKLIGDIRGGYTAGMAAKGSSGTRQLVKAMNDGALVFMVVDQKNNTGMEIPFFGRGAFTGPGVVRIAMRFNCPVFPVRTERLDGAKFKVTIEAPWTFPPDGSDDDVRAALTRINQRLEDWIRARPGQWLWMHKRWPKES